MQPRSLTLTSHGGLLRALIGDLKVAEAGMLKDGDSTSDLPGYKGIWDTGATNSVVTQKVVDNLKLQQIGVAKVNGVHGEDTSPVFLVDFILPLGLTIPGLRVTLGKLPNDTDVLIGMDIISLGDFSVTNLDGRTKMSFRIPSCAEVDYVEEAAKSQYTRKERRAMDRKKK